MNENCWHNCEATPTKVSINLPTPSKNISFQERIKLVQAGVGGCNGCDKYWFDNGNFEVVFNDQD